MFLPPGRQYAMTSFVSLHSISSPDAVVRLNALTATLAFSAFATHSGHKEQEQDAGCCPHGRATRLHNGGCAPRAAAGPTQAGRGAALEEAEALLKACLACWRARDRSALRALAVFPCKTCCIFGPSGTWRDWCTGAAGTPQQLPSRPVGSPTSQTETHRDNFACLGDSSGHGRRRRNARAGPGSSAGLVC